MRQIPLDQVVTKIATENPWWNSPHSIPAMYDELQPRPYLDLFYPLATNRDISRAIVLMGPRRVGKTVMIHHAIRRLIEGGTKPLRLCYVSVDQPLYNGLRLDQILDAYAEATQIDLQRDEVFAFFDEIQYLKDWEVQLKGLVDRHRNIQFVASGSAAAALKLKSRESGAGRFTDFLLPPLTFHEYLTLLNSTQLIDATLSPTGYINDALCTDMEELNRHFISYLNFGGYPEVAFSKLIQQDPARYVKSDIIDKVLLRDLPSLYGVQDVQELNYLFTTLAYNTANEVSLEQISSGSGVAKNTIKRYIEYLEAAFLVKTVHRIDRNAKRFKRANFFKVYLTNASMRAALFTPVDSGDQATGALVETAIFSQWFHSEAQLYYARWSAGEVDIVSLKHDQKVGWALEAKWSDRIVTHPEELKNLLSFCRKHNLKQTTVTTKTGRKRVEIDNVEINFVPAALHCFVLGHNVVHTRQRHSHPA